MMRRGDGAEKLGMPRGIFEMQERVWRVLPISNIRAMLWQEANHEVGNVLDLERGERHGCQDDRTSSQTQTRSSCAARLDRRKGRERGLGEGFEGAHTNAHPPANRLPAGILVGRCLLKESF